MAFDSVTLYVGVLETKNVSSQNASNDESEVSCLNDVDQAVLNHL